VTVGASWPALTDEQAETVAANLGLVGWVLGKAGTPEREWDDSWQDGVLGLCRAAQLFDPDRGFRFSTYARAWIMQGIQKGRDELLGSGFRRARDRGVEWSPPLSLDSTFEVESHTMGPLTEVGVVDRGPGVERQAVASVTLDEARALARSWGLDDLGRSVVEALFASPDGESFTMIDARLAAVHGVSRETARRRRAMVQGRFRTWSRQVAA
jgi:hypothetical protein